MLLVFSSYLCIFFFFSSRRRHTRCLSDWSSDVCSSDLSLNSSRPLAPTAGIESRKEKRAAASRLIPAKSAPVMVVPERDRSEERRVGKERRTGGCGLESNKK